MGNRTTRILNSKKATVTALAQAYLTLSQDISQGVNVEQQIFVNCGQNGLKKYCFDCIKSTKEYGYDPKMTELICDGTCKCKVKNVFMGQRMFYNSKIFQRSDISNNFEQQFLNSLAQQASSEDTGIKLTGNNVKNVTESIENIKNYMQSDVFQAAMEQMSQKQKIAIFGVGTVSVIDLRQSLDYISNVLQESTIISNDISKLQQTVLQMATEITISGIDQLILWIIRIALFILVIIVLFYAINLIFQIYSLYVQK